VSGLISPIVVLFGKLKIENACLGRALSRYAKLLLWIRNFQNCNLTVPLVFEQFVNKHPDKTCIIFEGKIWTFKMVTFKLMTEF
jgi:hypothetical protein